LRIGCAIRETGTVVASLPVILSGRAVPEAWYILPFLWVGLQMILAGAKIRATL